jgi:hypothetical protein
VVYDDLAGKVDAQLLILTRIKTEEITAFNKAFADKNLPVIVTKK